MPNSSSAFGQLQRAGVQRLITDRKGRTREGGPGSGPHPESEQARVLLHKHLTGEFPGQKFSTIQALLKSGHLEQDGKNLKVSAKGKAWADENHMKVPSSRKKESRSRESKRIREAISARAFMEQGKDEQSKTSGKKNRVYLVTIIEEGLGNSKDKNYYSKEALLSGPQVFNGAKAYCDHPDAITEKTLPERSMRDVVGWYSDCFTDTNPQTGKTRLRGKLHFFPDAKWLTDKIDTILTDPTAKNLFGISINAVGKTRPATMGGEEVNYVEQFQRVDSADVVTEPAARGKFDQMLESRRSAARSNSRKVSRSRMSVKKYRTRESAVLGPDELKEVADSLVSAYNSDNPDETKEAAFAAAQRLHAASSISGKGPGQANEEQYSNINPSGGRESMAKKRVKASSFGGGKRTFRKGKRHLVAAGGTGADNEDEGEPEPSDIDNELEEADVEDEEGRGDMGEQADFGGGSKYHKVKAAQDGDDDDDDQDDDDDDDLDDMDEAFEDSEMGMEEDEGFEGAEGAEGMEDEGMEGAEGLEDEGFEDEGMEDEDENFGGSAGAGMPPGGGGMPGAGAAAPAGGGAPGSSRTVASAEAGGRRRFSRRGSRGLRRRTHEADSSGQGAPIKKASYAGGLGHSGHSGLPKGADPTRGYEDSDEDFGKSDDSTSGVGKSYKIKTSRFARNRREARVAKPVVREANRRIERLSREIARLRESNRAKDIKINRYSGKLFYINSGKEAEKLLREAVKKDYLPVGTAETLYPNLLGLSKVEQIREIKRMARFIESASEGVTSRLTESVEGSGARGGFAFRESAGQNSELVDGLAKLGVPMKKEE